MNDVKGIVFVNNRCAYRQYLLGEIVVANPPKIKIEDAVLVYPNCESVGLHELPDVNDIVNRLTPVI